jgi:hypothetical protein
LIHNGINNNHLYEHFDGSSYSNLINEDINNSIKIQTLIAIFGYYLVIYGQWIIRDVGIADICKKNAAKKDKLNDKYFKLAQHYFYKYWTITKKKMITMMNKKKENFENVQEKFMNGYDAMLEDSIDSQAAIAANIYYIALTTKSIGDSILSGKIDTIDVINIAEKYILEYWNMLNGMSIDKIKEELDDAKKEIEKDEKYVKRRIDHRIRLYEKEITASYKESVSNINETINSYGDDIKTLFCGN